MKGRPIRLIWSTEGVPILFLLRTNTPELLSPKFVFVVDRPSVCHHRLPTPTSPDLCLRFFFLQFRVPRSHTVSGWMGIFGVAIGVDFPIYYLLLEGCWPPPPSADGTSSGRSADCSSSPCGLSPLMPAFSGDVFPRKGWTCSGCPG